jgi:hypothetical protein
MVEALFFAEEAVLSVDPLTAISIAIETYKAARAGYEVVLWLDDTISGGKQKFGSFYIRDSIGDKWKVRVRADRKRGRYIKLSRKGEEVVATVEPYKPLKYGPDGGYYRVSLEGWKACVVLADGESSNKRPLFYCSAFVETVRDEVIDDLTYLR